MLKQQMQAHRCHSPRSLRGPCMRTNKMCAGPRARNRPRQGPCRPQAQRAAMASARRSFFPSTAFSRRARTIPPFCPAMLSYRAKALWHRLRSAAPSALQVQKRKGWTLQGPPFVLLPVNYTVKSNT